MTKKDPRAAAAEIVAEKYPEARVVFLAGSVVRGEDTQTSDLDLVVIFDSLPQAYDIRAPRSRHELAATASRLYPLLAEHYLRSRQLWSARGKWIPRRLSSISAGFGEAFCEAFREVFEEGVTAKLIALCEDVLRPVGGWLFDGHILHAPESWRVAERKRT